MDQPLNLVLFSGTDDRLQAAAVLTAGAAALGKPVNVFLQYWALDAFTRTKIRRDHGLAPEAGPDGRARVVALARAGQAPWAETLRQAKALGVIDIVIPEPAEGAHADHAETARRIRSAVVEQLDALSAVPLDELVEARYRRFRTLGAYREVEAAAPPVPERPGIGDRLRNLLDPGRWSGISTIPAGRRDEPPARDEV